jgi:TolB-like protein
VRLEGLAAPGGICVSGTVRDHIGDRLPYAFEDMGEQSVKNIARPVRAYALRPGGLAPLPAPAFAARSSRRGRAIIGTFATAALVIACIAWWVWPATAPSSGAGKPVAEATGASTPMLTAPGAASIAHSAAPRLSIVVLPFANLNNDPEQQYFADSLTDDLTTDLSRLAEMFVISRNTAFTYKNKSINARQIGRELGVRYVLEGSVRRSNNAVQVNVQLIDAENDAHLWADRFDADSARIAETQNEIVGRLARTLNLALVQAAGRRIEREGTIDPSARDLVMRGWAELLGADASRKEIQGLFERALEIDPRSVYARIGLARILIGKLTYPRSGAFEKDEARAEQLLTEALKFGGSQAETHATMGLLRRMQNRSTEARVEWETAIALDRNNSWAYYELGVTVMYLGQPEAAIPHIEKAMRLNPGYPNIAEYFWGLGACQLLLGHVDEAIELLRKARAANPRPYFIHLWLAGALGLRGDLNEARMALAEVARIKPELISLADIRTHYPWSANPQHSALREQTIDLGLRRAGMPDG